MTRAEILLDGLRFPEGPRHGPDGRLYFSDQHGHRVYAVDIGTGERETVCEVSAQPSGLGWLPDGRLLVVSMTDRTVLRREPDGTLVRHAALGEAAAFHANDMLVDAVGRAYVGNFGFDLHAHYLAASLRSALGLPVPGAALALVTPDGSVRTVADDLRFPNGMVLLPDGTFVVAETMASRLTAFDVDPDGGLRNRRVWANLRWKLIAPDGICVDADGGIWVAGAIRPGAFRIAEGGRVTDVVHTSQNCFAVALTGPDRRTLVCCTAPTSLPHKLTGTPAPGKLETARVPIPDH